MKAGVVASLGPTFELRHRPGAVELLAVLDPERIDRLARENQRLSGYARARLPLGYDGQHA